MALSSFVDQIRVAKVVEVSFFLWTISSAIMWCFVFFQLPATNAIESKHFYELSQTSFEFAYVGSAELFTVPISGRYRVDAFGAAGKGYSAGEGGMGGFVSAEFSFGEGNEIYVFVGGTPTGFDGGFNGGGSVASGGGGGGGASDLRFVSSDLNTRIIVAGGGGGAGGEGGASGGDGGGSFGGSGQYSCSRCSFCVAPTGGTLTAGGEVGTCNTASDGEDGTFGYGASSQADNSGGGGGGWYGGGTPSNAFDGSGGGGSNYVVGGTVLSDLQGVSSSHGNITIALLEEGSLTFTSWQFDFVDTFQALFVPATGTYQLDVYGAEGCMTCAHNYASNSWGGLGGLLSSSHYFKANTLLYVFVGGQNGYNGGGVMSKVYYNPVAAHQTSGSLLRTTPLALWWQAEEVVEDQTAMLIAHFLAEMVVG